MHFQIGSLICCAGENAPADDEMDPQVKEITSSSAKTNQESSSCHPRP